MEVLKLLDSKNRCLNKFLKYSETFLMEAQAGNLTEIDRFQNQREAIIKALQLYDRKISEETLKLSSLERTPALIASAQQAFLLREKIIEAILKIDQNIMAEIEKEKNRLIQELSDSDKNHHLVMKFKSKWVSEPGETLDGQI
jgi:hypothetical protein